MMYDANGTKLRSLRPTSNQILLPVQFGAPLGFRLAAISVIGQFIPRDRIQLMIAQIAVRFVDEAQF
jgi:hypothetical protein